MSSATSNVCDADRFRNPCGPGGRSTTAARLVQVSASTETTGSLTVTTDDGDKVTLLTRTAASLAYARYDYRGRLDGERARFGRGAHRHGEPGRVAHHRGRARRRGAGGHRQAGRRARGRGAEGVRWTTPRVRSRALRRTAVWTPSPAFELVVTRAVNVAIAEARRATAGAAAPVDDETPQPPENVPTPGAAPEARAADAPAPAADVPARADDRDGRRCATWRTRSATPGAAREAPAAPPPRAGARRAASRPRVHRRSVSGDGRRRARLAPAPPPLFVPARLVYERSGRGKEGPHERSGRRELAGRSGGRDARSSPAPTSPTTTSSTRRRPRTSSATRSCRSSTSIEAKKEGLMPALLKRAGELGLLMIDIPERVRRPRAPQDDLDAGLRARRAVRVVQRVVGRAHRHRHAADRLLRHRGAEAALPAEARDRRVARRLRAHRAAARAATRSAAQDRAPCSTPDGELSA